MPKSLLTACLTAVALIGLFPITISADENSPTDLFAPVFVNRPHGAMYFPHCDTARYTFQAVSAATGMPSPFVRYRIVSGPGVIDSVTGEWKHHPTTNADSIGTYTLEIAAREFNLETEGLQNCFADTYIYNEPPRLYFTISPTPLKVHPLDTARQLLRCPDYDRCDSVVVWIESIVPPFAGSALIERTGDLCDVKLVPALADSAKNFMVTISSTDGYAVTSRSFTLQVFPTAHFAVRVGNLSQQRRGTIVDVPVYLDRRAPNIGLGSFDFLFAYDHDALGLQKASIDSSDVYRKCEWEYFNYRFESDYCTGDCPGGLVRVVGLANVNVGTHYPICKPELTPDLPAEFFRLQFLISNDSTWECSWLPIRPFWRDCADNSLSSAAGDRLFVVDSVFERLGPNASYVSITNHNANFPGYGGVPSSCMVMAAKASVERGVFFYGGGIDVICVDSGGGPTDVNDESTALPVDFALYQNYPNPFNPSTTISFDIPHPVYVTLEIVNILGQVVWSSQTYFGVGRHEIVWDGKSGAGAPVSSGVYYYRFQAGDFTETRKMILLK